MDETFDKTAIETVDLLEARLRGIEYATYGQQTLGKPEDKLTAAKRLASLEHTLHQLASKNPVVQDLLRLYARHPDLFQALKSDEVPTLLDTSSILSIVLACAPSYPSTASQLTSITDTPIPSAEQSLKFIELIPRIAKVEAIQASQKAEIARLRERTANLLLKYRKHVVDGNQGWANLDGRTREVEKGFKRRAALKKMDEGIFG
ncbi:hypothetical protein BJ878DRAFT_59352 [Calycina marina]|uniref:Nuclear distribution protein RO10 n=1 Tax=Calycina marina TaxID=1763456 RepID=A0A9P7Z497_9HELO|nr:hypothetical protein BJ878DRAFT_59352 [Calycina marina]